MEKILKEHSNLPKEYVEARDSLHQEYVKTKKKYKRSKDFVDTWQATAWAVWGGVMYGLSQSRGESTFDTAIGTLFGIGTIVTGATSIYGCSQRRKLGKEIKRIQLAKDALDDKLYRTIN